MPILLLEIGFAPEKIVALPIGVDLWKIDFRVLGRRLAAVFETVASSLNPVLLPREAWANTTW